MDNIVEVIIFIIVAVGAGLSKIYAQMQEAKKREALQKKLQQPRQPQPGPAPRQAPKVIDEVDEFLRRAATKREQRPQTQQPAQRSGGAPAGRPQPAPVRRIAPANATPVLQAEVLDQGESRGPVGGQVSKQVEKYLDSGQFRERASQLGGGVVAADQEINQHLRQVFDHQVSRLENAGGEAAQPPEAAVPPDIGGVSAEMPSLFTSGLFDILSQPESLCQAIVLSEILRRPEERWV